MKQWLQSLTVSQWLVVLWIALAPIRPALYACLALPLADLILALVVAYKAKQPITSAGLKRSIAKITMYLAGTILAFIAETYLTGPAVPCIHLVTGLIGVTELKSCLEHLDELNGSSIYASIIKALAPPPNPPGAE